MPGLCPLSVGCMCCRCCSPAAARHVTRPELPFPLLLQSSTNLSCCYRSKPALLLTLLRQVEAEAYWVSKVQAERAAWEMAEQHGLDLVTILPGGLGVVKSVVRA